MPDDVFADLKAVLQSLKDHLDNNVGVIQPALSALRLIVPGQVDALLTGLGDVLTDLVTELQALNVNAVPGLDETGEFAQRVAALAGAVRPLMPDATGRLDALDANASYIASLPSLGAVRADLIALSEAILAHLESLAP